MVDGYCIRTTHHRDEDGFLCKTILFQVSLQCSLPVRGDIFQRWNVGEQLIELCAGGVNVEVAQLPHGNIRGPDSAIRVSFQHFFHADVGAEVTDRHHVGVIEYE